MPVVTALEAFTRFFTECGMLLNVKSGVKGSLRAYMSPLGEGETLLHERSSCCSWNPQEFHAAAAGGRSV